MGRSGGYSWNSATIGLLSSITVNQLYLAAIKFGVQATNGPIWRILIWHFTADPTQTYCRENEYNSLNNGPIFKI